MTQALHAESTKQATGKTLDPIDITIIALYLAVIALMALGFWYYQYKKKMKGTDNFFTGGGKNPILIVGLSMFATIVSALGLLNVPGYSFSSRWMWAGINIALIGVTPFIAIWVVPFYRRIKESTVYAFLENRYHYSIRALSSISFIFYQIFRVATVLFVPITALSAIVDINEYLWVVIVGVVVILTTAFGGFKAVIWSDAVQGTVFLVGILSVIIAALVKTDWNSDKTQYHQIIATDTWKADKLQAGIALIFLYNSINALHAFMGSQDVTQRYKGTKTVGSIRKTLYVTGIVNIIMTLFFFGAGSALFSYYTSTGWDPASKYDGIQVGLKNNQFLMYAVASLLPVGLIGFFIASVFAASQSTISSGLSALSNSIIIDFIKRWFPKISDRKLTILSKSFVGIFGVLAIGFSALLIYIKQDKLFDWFAGVVALFNAPMIAVILLALFTVRANWRGCLIGYLIGFALAISLWVPSQEFIPADKKLQFLPVYLVLVSFSTTMIISWVSSLLFYKFHEKTRIENATKIVNRTIWTTSKEFKTITKIEGTIYTLEKWERKGLVTKESLDAIKAKITELDTQLNTQTEYKVY